MQHRRSNNEIQKSFSRVWKDRSSRQACNFLKKETLAQVLSCEFWDISKNTFFYLTPPVEKEHLGKMGKIFN